MTTHAVPTPPARDCAQFDAQLSAWLEHDLDAAGQAFMSRHRAACAACDAMVSEIEQVVAESAALPPLGPSRDLWQGIEARLDAPVIPLPTPHRVAAAPPRRRTVSVRTFAIAATLLVAVSSGVTWQLAQRTGAAVGPAVATAGGRAAAPGGAVDDASSTGAAQEGTDGAASAPAGDAPVTATPSVGRGADRVRLVSDDRLPAVDVTYEREIVTLRQLVDERFTELDSATVSTLRRNLDIIDRAILDSRQALARDPRSALVADQLDRTLQAKLDLLRRVALL
jgi:hypothetical protein